MRQKVESCEASAPRQMRPETEANREKRQRELKEYFEPLEEEYDEYGYGWSDDDSLDCKDGPARKAPPIEIPDVAWELDEISG